MKFSFFVYYLFFLILIPQCLTAQNSKTAIYLIPGQGADARQFQKLTFPEEYEIRNIEYFTPEKGWDLRDFAIALAQQIDTTENFLILGVSLGGMLATEMGDFLKPEKIILISSAKCRDELPGRYKFQKTIPLNILIPGGLAKWGAKFLQPIVEPDSKKDRQFFKSMLDDKDPAFLRRTINMIIRWDHEECSNNIIHIHGYKDHTIPSKNVEIDYLITDGSHMMVYTRAEEISEMLQKILSNN
jgi:pimeloyl-ACP methyl ester carboxylesterase